MGNTTSDYSKNILNAFSECKRKNAYDLLYRQ